MTKTKEYVFRNMCVRYNYASFKKKYKAKNKFQDISVPLKGEGHESGCELSLMLWIS